MEKRKQTKKGRLSAVRSNELLCCPFCGNQKPYLHSNRVWNITKSSIWCDPGLGGCGARGPEKDMDEEAIIGWNIRAT